MAKYNVSGEAVTTRIGETDIAIMRGETIGTATTIGGADPATGDIPRREGTRRRGDTNPIPRHHMGKGPAGRIWLLPYKLHFIVNNMIVIHQYRSPSPYERDARPRREYRSRSREYDRRY